MRRTVIAIAFGTLALIGGAGIWGLFLPADHVAASELTLPVPPEQVFNAIRDIAHYPDWWEGVESVTPVASTDGWERWRERSGGMSTTIIIAQEEYPLTMTTRIDTLGHPPISGTWTYEDRLAPGGRTTLRITERGHLANPYFRVVRRLQGAHTTLDSYLSALGARFGTATPPVHVVP